MTEKPDALAPLDLSVDAEAVARIKATMAGRLSPRTRAIYAGLWSEWERWAKQRGVPVLPARPEALLVYFDECASGKVTGHQLGLQSLSLRRAVISAAHHQVDANAESPCYGRMLSDYFEGLRKTKPASKGKAAAAADEVRAMLAVLDRRLAHATTQMAQLVALRDRALILVGFIGGLRRSNLVKVCVEHLVRDASGVKLYIPRSKTDQAGEGKWVGLEEPEGMSPVVALRDWLTAAGITSGPVFRGVRHGVSDTALSPGQVSETVKELAQAAGLDAGAYNGWSSHSLRAGIVTELLAAGLDAMKVAERTGHRSMKVLAGYNRPRSPVNPQILDALNRRRK